MKKLWNVSVVIFVFLSLGAAELAAFNGTIKLRSFTGSMDDQAAKNKAAVAVVHVNGSSVTIDSAAPPPLPASRDEGGFCNLVQLGTAPDQEIRAKLGVDAYLWKGELSGEVVEVLITAKFGYLPAAAQPRVGLPGEAAKAYQDFLKRERAYPVSLATVGRAFASSEVVSLDEDPERTAKNLSPQHRRLRRRRRQLKREQEDLGD